MNRSLLAASISVLALTAGTAALAQTSAPTPIQVGGTLSATLDDADPTQGEEDGAYRYEDYALTAREGQRLEAVMRGDDFDAYLELFKAGETDEAIASDDDGLGEGTHSRLRFVAPEAGNYVLRARTLSGTDGGDYTLSLTQRPAAPRAPRPSTLRKDVEVNGSLSARDPESDEGARYDAYSIRLGEGDRVAVSLDSEAFDPVVRIGRMVRGSFAELAQNDDKPGGGLGSYLVFTAPADGDYIIRATGLDDAAEGDYTLKLTDGPPPLAAKPIAIGDEVEGELTSEDGSNDTGQRADAYSFTATAGQRVEIMLDSDAFDAYLELFGPDGASLGEDDDNGDEGTNSRLVRTLAAGGSYTVQARALGDDATGAYTLKITEAAPVPEATPIAFGQTLQGEVTADGVRDDEGRGYVAYRFQGTEGARAQITVRSGDFDSFVQLGRPGEAFEALSSDDDGLGEGTDSRLTFKLPSTGEYEVRASPLGGEEKGLFSIELQDMGPQPLPGSILVGATARGTLTDNDALTDEGQFYDAYRIQAASEEKLTITMASNDLDAYLDVGREKADGSFESLASDDDGLSDTHAKLEWSAERAGAYVIRARSFGTGQTGAYTLTVERKP